MLSYLVNVISLDPNTYVGQRQRKGLNENYARELIELHTLGIEGGYDEGDLAALARILTG